MKNITVIFPEVKLEIEMEKLTFDTLENIVHRTGDELKRLVIEKAIKDIDEQLRKGRAKKQLENRGKRGKYLLTRFGDIRYKRSRYKDRKSKGSRYLLDEALGVIKNQRISLVRAQMEIHLASLSPYRKVVEQTELIGNYKRSHESIRQSVIREAERIIEHQQKSLDKIENLDYEQETKPQEKVYAEADATFIKLQKRRRGKRKSRKKKTLEVKLGIGYTDKKPRYAGGRRKSNKLKDKFVFTSIGSTGKKFMNNLSLITEKKLGLSKAKKIFFGGDGGNWIRKGIKDYFPGAIYLLCLFHICRNIRESLSWRKQEQKIIKDLLMTNQIDKALAQVY